MQGKELNDVRVCLYFLFVQSHPSVSLSFSFSLLQHLPDPMEIIIIQEEKREAQRDDEAEEKPSTPSTPKRRKEVSRRRKKGFLIALRAFHLGALQCDSDFEREIPRGIEVETGIGNSPLCSWAWSHGRRR